MNGKVFLHKVESAKAMTLTLRVVATGRADYNIASEPRIQPKLVPKPAE